MMPRLNFSTRPVVRESRPWGLLMWSAWAALWTCVGYVGGSFALMLWWPLG